MHTARAAGELLFDHMEKFARRHNGDMFRASQLYTSEVDQMLRASSLELKTAWIQYSKETAQMPDAKCRSKKSKDVNGICLSSWVKCCVKAFESESEKQPFSVSDLVRFFSASTLNFGFEEKLIMNFPDFLEGLCRLARFLTKSSFQEASKSVKLMVKHQTTQNSSWAKIRELSLLHSIFLEEEGRFLSIQNGGLISVKKKKKGSKLTKHEDDKTVLQSGVDKDMQTRDGDVHDDGTEGEHTQSDGPQGEDEQKGTKEEVDGKDDDDQNAYLASILDVIQKVCKSLDQTAAL